MFPKLTPAEMAGARRFGTPVAFDTGADLFSAGKTAPGLFLIESGEVRITQRDGFGSSTLIIDHGPGEFAAEVGQLSGRAALVDGQAMGPVKATLIPPENLRALLIAEADLGELILRALILRRASLIEAGDGGPVLIGPVADPGMTRLTGFLTRNGHPFRVLAPEVSGAATDLMLEYAPTADELPIVVCYDGTVMRNPTEHALATALGMIGQPDTSRIYDVAIVGAGPAGLATAVYAASEGLSVIVLEMRSFGGQAGASARIENYFGFPTGISGQALVARAFTQAQKFGTEMAIPTAVSALECAEGEELNLLHLEDGATVTARTVVIASGARYRRPAIANLERFESRGVWYWASPVEAKMCAGTDVILVGGGNSAGQAAVYLASHAHSVRLMVRAEGIEATMSRYLIDRITSLENVQILTRTQITALHGGTSGLAAVTWSGPGEVTTAPIRNVFLFVGADPATDWLKRCAIDLDDRGFVVTGAMGAQALETSQRGVFAVGDVRSGSVKRVGGAIGEGAQVVAQIHALLAATASQPNGAKASRA
jgi:thioredoxin reductase (NADPH)